MFLFSLNNLSLTSLHTHDFFHSLIKEYRVCAVYHVAMKQPSGSFLVVNICTADVRLTSDRIVTVFLVLVELSSSISGSHAAIYVVKNMYLKYVLTSVSKRICNLVGVYL